jgi:hypothetical protein
MVESNKSFGTLLHFLDERDARSDRQSARGNTCLATSTSQIGTHPRAP